MAGPGDLYALAVEFLGACSAALDDAPGGPIAYNAISPGPPAYDCAPAVYIHLGGPSVADTLPFSPSLQPTHRIGVQGMVDMIQMTCTVLRCVPTIEGPGQGQTIKLPPATAISAAAAEVYGDLWAIWNYLKNAYRAGLLFQSPSGNREFIFFPAVPVKAQGGVAGWEMSVGVQLGGYPSLH